LDFELGIFFEKSDDIPTTSDKPRPPSPAAASDSPEPAPAPGTESAPEAESTQSAATTEASTERLVKGKTSFQEILDWGVSQEIIE
jgi:hypothetical protein